MPRATGPAADAAMPESAEATTPLASEFATGGQVAADPAQPWGNWRYTGSTGRIYTHVPVTCYGGEVIAWPEAPADDGAWEPTTDPVTTQPDNHRPEFDSQPADAPKEG